MTIAREGGATDCGAKPGQICSVTDPNGHVTSYGYQGGNLTSITYPAPLGAVMVSNDSLSRPTTVTDGKGQTRTFTYDNLDRVTLVNFASGPSVSYAYDPDGNLTSTTDATGTTTFSYDTLNRQLSKTMNGTRQVTYTYDRNNNLATLANNGGTVTYAYDAVNHVTSVADPSGTTQVTYATDGSEHRTGVVFPSGVTVALHPDASNRPTHITAIGPSSTLEDLTYSYATAGGIDTGLRQKLTDNRTGTVTPYVYDSMNRLTDATATGGAPRHDAYSYDPAGNRTSHTVNAHAAESYSYNAANELTARTGGDLSALTFAYDPNGNETSASDGTGITYNAKNQTTAMTSAFGTLGNMTYMGNDQTERVTAGQKSYVTSALGTDSEQVSANVTLYYTRDPGGALLNERIVDTSGGTATTTRYDYLLDGIGSVVALANSAGASAASYSYDPYGQQITAEPTILNPWRFASGYYDKATHFTKFGTRYYDASLGRWTQQDPLSGNLSSPTTLNRYVYAGDDPVNLVDSTGRDFTLDCIGVAIGASVAFLAFTLFTEGLDVVLLALLPTIETSSAAAAGIAGCLGLSVTELFASLGL